MLPVGFLEWALSKQVTFLTFLCLAAVCCTTKAGEKALALRMF